MMSVLDIELMRRQLVDFWSNPPRRASGQQVRELIMPAAQQARLGFTPPKPRVAPPHRVPWPSSFYKVVALHLDAATPAHSTKP